MSNLQTSTTTSTIAVGYYNSQENVDSINIVSKSREFGYDFVVLPLTNTNYKRFLFENVNHDNKGGTIELEKWRNGNSLIIDDLVVKTAGKFNIKMYAEIVCEIIVSLKEKLIYIYIYVLDNSEITIGKIPEWINLDSSDQNTRINSEIVIYMKSFLFDFIY
jgi:hypothetical protein